MKKFIMTFFLSVLALSLSGQTKTTSKTTSSKTSVSVEKTNKKYVYTSYFEASKTNAAKSIIISNLGTPNEDNTPLARWTRKGVIAKVWNGKIQIIMEYSMTPKAMIIKVEKMADEISKVIN